MFLENHEGLTSYRHVTSRYGIHQAPFHQNTIGLV